MDHTFTRHYGVTMEATILLKVLTDTLKTSTWTQLSRVSKVRCCQFILLIQDNIYTNNGLYASNAWMHKVDNGTMNKKH